MELRNEVLKWVSTLSGDENRFLIETFLNPLSFIISICNNRKHDTVIGFGLYPCDICPYQEVCYTITDLIKSIIEVTKKK